LGSLPKNNAKAGTLQTLMRSPIANLKFKNASNPDAIANRQSKI
jgi:hypothetical protein